MILRWNVALLLLCNYSFTVALILIKSPTPWTKTIRWPILRESERFRLKKIIDLFLLKYEQERQKCENNNVLIWESVWSYCKHEHTSCYGLVTAQKSECSLLEMFYYYKYSSCQFRLFYSIYSSGCILFWWNPIEIEMWLWLRSSTITRRLRNVGKSLFADYAMLVNYDVCYVGQNVIYYVNLIDRSGILRLTFCNEIDIGTFRAFPRRIDWTHVVRGA